MNKTENINLGGYPFVIDDDAFKKLKQYLDAIQIHFSNSEGYEEITTDIEIRIGEIFQERMEGKRMIVILKDVEAAISVMGTPEDFGAEAEVSETNTYSKSEDAEKKTPKYKTGKRLFKNPDEKMIDGVASGISAYFGIEDPIWIRIAFVVMALSGGIGIPLYIVLMIILPEALSASDKLAMKGEPINVSNIAKTIETEMEHLSKRINELGNEFKKGKKKGNNDETKMGKGVEEEWDTKASIKEGMTYVAAAIALLAKVIQKVIKPILFIVGAALILAAAVYWISIIIGFVVAYPHATYFVEQWQFPFIAISGLLTFIIPILSLVLVVVRLLFKSKVGTAAKVGMWVVFFISVSTLVTFAVQVADDFSSEKTISSIVPLEKIEGDTIVIHINKDKYDDGLIQLGDRAKLNNDQFFVYDVTLSVEASTSTEIELVEERFARGNTYSKAQTNAGNVMIALKQTGNTINVDPGYLVPKGKKWRNQQIDYHLKVPEGTTVVFENENSHGHHHNPFIYNRLIEAGNKTGVMEGGSIVVSE